MNTALLLIPAVLAIGQPEKPVAAAPEAKSDPSKAILIDKLQPLSPLLGQWSGEGWTGSLKLRRPFRMQAQAQARFNGKVILFDMAGLAASAEGAGDGPLHEMVAMLSWDSEANSYRLRAVRTDGNFIEAKVLELTDKKLVWVLEPGGSRQIRHTITINEKGQWHEVGELSRDSGRNFLAYLDLTLDKKLGQPAP